MAKAEESAGGRWGEKSHEFTSEDMVFQGTVPGPLVWNVFYEDARRAIEEWMFQEIVYAADLNAYREFVGTTENAGIFGTIDMCKKGLHAWGRANQVAFEPSKESKHVISVTDPEGPSFKLLGI